MVRRFLACLAGVLCLAAAGTAQQAAKTEPEGKVVRELWDAAYLDGARAGYINTTVREVERGDKKYYVTRVYLELTLRRFDDVIRQKMESGTVETTDGKVVSVWMSQTLGKDQKLTLAGVVQGKLLNVKINGPATIERQIPWNDQVIGLYREHQIFQEKKAEPGLNFSYQHYEPVINNVVTVQVAVKDFESIEINKTKQLLLKAEATPDKFMGVQLPKTNFWLNKDLQVVRSHVDMPGVGNLVLLRAPREVALSPVVPSKIADIGVTQLVLLNRRVPNPGATTNAVYRITLPNEDEPSKTFPVDGRQQVKNAKGKSFELHVRSVRAPEKVAQPEQAAPEFLASNYFINSADAKVQEHARKAVGTETDTWKKAVRIEQWVNRNMKVLNFGEAMATADHVARTLEGDCTEYGMLTAAMCRAAGVPSRTALGLIYVDMPRGPVFAYHMWTEVFVQGQWLALDATLGQGGIGAAHIKIADHSWHEISDLKPLLPVTRVLLGKVAIEVVRVEPAE